MMNSDNLMPFLIGAAVGYFVVPRVIARLSA